MRRRVSDHSGILLALAGSALAAGELTALLAPCVMLLAYLRKLRMEEALLALVSGQEYEDYRREVKALVPGIL